MSLFVTVLAESTHTHEHSCDAPCAAACLGGSCVCPGDNSDSKQAIAPVPREKPVLVAFEPLFVPSIFEEEIFHPPVV